MNQVEPKSFIALCKEHLSLQGESLKDFAEGMKKLTPKDREELTVAFEAMGYVIKPSA